MATAFGRDTAQTKLLPELSPCVVLRRLSLAVLGVRMRHSQDIRMFVSKTAAQRGRLNKYDFPRAQVACSRFHARMPKACSSPHRLFPHSQATVWVWRFHTGMERRHW
eukprot:5311815-Alexandrium_andersonii.AAC.1